MAINEKDFVPIRYPLVVIESPLRGSVRRNVAYAKAAMLDSIGRGEAPYASHLLYAQAGILDDTNADERKAGMARGLAWSAKGDLVAAYVDLGVSDGMRAGIEAAGKAGTAIEYRTVPGWKWPPA